MDREGPYLPIGIKISFIGGSVWKIQGGGRNNPRWLAVLQKIAWLDEGYFFFFFLRKWLFTMFPHIELRDL